MNPTETGRSSVSLMRSYRYYFGEDKPVTNDEREKAAAIKTAEGIMKIMRGEVKPYQFKPARELTDAECAVLRIEKETR